MHSMSKAELRQLIRNRLDEIAGHINQSLRGKGLRKLEPVLRRIGHGGRTPHWYEKLVSDGTLPNLDGKTIGSVVEMLLVAVLETHVLKSLKLPPLRINPAKGIDLPDFDLGVKSPSENFCTSEPFFSAYDRLLGSEYDIVVLLTDYQTAKSKPPLRLQIMKWRYLSGTQVADANLCRIARTQRAWLLEKNESWAKKVFRFLAYVNQGDWLGKKLVGLVNSLQDNDAITLSVEQALIDFERRNNAAERADKPLIPEDDRSTLERLLQVSPLHLGVIDAADNWVVETQKDSGRPPNDNEWNRLVSGPLDGKIGMSVALQWRYNFARLFSAAKY